MIYIYIVNRDLRLRLQSGSLMPTRSQGQRCYCSLCPPGGKFFRPHELEVHKSRLIMAHHATIQTTRGHGGRTLPINEIFRSVERIMTPCQSTMSEIEIDRAGSAEDVLRSFLNTLEYETQNLRSLFCDADACSADRIKELESVEERVRSICEKADSIHSPIAANIVDRLKSEIVERSDALVRWVSELRSLCTVPVIWKTQELRYDCGELRIERLF